MGFTAKQHTIGALAIVTVVILLTTTACSAPTRSPHQSAPHTSQALVTPTDAWSALLQRSPYPYASPLPPPTPTLLDGTYTKVELKQGTPVPCRRCPDYSPEGGVWKLNLDKGAFRIFHPATGWRSMGSFTVSGNQLALANDPTCPSTIGTYTWRLEEGELILSEVEDDCAIHVRATNLTNLPWLSCYPPKVEAAATDRWPKPPGCD
jgi:hypothetical protein